MADAINAIPPVPAACKKGNLTICRYKPQVKLFRKSEENRKRSNEYFTAALIGILIFAAVTWIAVIFFDRELLILFDAQEYPSPGKADPSFCQAENDHRNKLFHLLY